MRTYICLQEADHHLVPVIPSDEKGAKRLMIDAASPLKDKAHIPIMLAAEPDFFNGVHLGDIDLGSIPDSERDMGIELLFSFDSDLKIHYCTGGVHPKQGAFIFGSRMIQQRIPVVESADSDIDWESAQDFDAGSETQALPETPDFEELSLPRPVLVAGILVYAGFIGGLVTVLINETFGMGWF